MRIMRYAAMLALLLPMPFATRAAGARAGEQSAGGVYKFSLEGDHAKYLEFEARSQDGAASGRMFFSDEAEVVSRDPDAPGYPQERQGGFYIRAELDALLVSGNRAVMSGTVADSNVADLVGRRVLLAVEDNGDNSKEPDRLTWGVYRPTDRDWTPSDAELERDEGVGLKWWATDAEVKDDAGVQMPRDESVGAHSFPLSSYDFPDFAHGAGDITVRP